MHNILDPLGGAERGVVAVMRTRAFEDLTHLGCSGLRRARESVLSLTLPFCSMTRSEGL